jgi:hypothetical protein
LKYLLAHVDLAPTILDLAGVDIPVEFAGKSFRLLLENGYSGLFRDWRPEGVLLEHWQDKMESGKVIHSTTSGIRMFDSVFLEWATGETEFYDLRLDPLQLENKSGSLAAGQRHYFESLIRFHKRDIASPVSNFADPFGPLGVTYQGAEISGTAEYRSDIREVRLVIRDVTAGTPQFWNGQTFQAEYTAVRADLDAPNLTLVNWSYDFTPPVSQTTRKLAITSRAYGVDGVYQPIPDLSLLWVEPDQPFGLITQPGFQTLTRKFPAHPMVITGWARDSDGIRLTRLVLRHSTTGMFWDGIGWQQDPTTLPVETITPLREDQISWTYNFMPPENSGAVNAVLRMVSSDPSKPVRTVTSRFSWSD